MNRGEGQNKQPLRIPYINIISYKNRFPRRGTEGGELVFIESPYRPGDRFQWEFRPYIFVSTQSMLRHNKRKKPGGGELANI